MKIHARITQESNDISEDEVKLLITYAHCFNPRKELEEKVKQILKKLYPNIDDSYGDNYIPGPWLDAIAEELNMGFNDHGCYDITL